MSWIPEDRAETFPAVCLNFKKRSPVDTIKSIDYLYLEGHFKYTLSLSPAAGTVGHHFHVQYDPIPKTYGCVLQSEETILFWRDVALTENKEKKRKDLSEQQFLLRRCSKIGNWVSSFAQNLESDIAQT
ncbi:hypothetical protein Vadar_032288 [Vaccinium darrowii]|uniref:Uncharacterized protein n=1 Tax=Vaccinium darrowii TaxID=229202 RepID=A0ACB7ZHV6_9ERIC|nr:hypothetical protein Vadar_032288 [Vaccinium darrowii]